MEKANFCHVPANGKGWIYIEKSFLKPYIINFNDMEANIW